MEILNRVIKKILMLCPLSAQAKSYMWPSPPKYSISVTLAPKRLDTSALAALALVK